MIHSKDVSIYPKAGLFRQGRTLYSWRFLGISERFWKKLMEKEPKDDMQINMRFYVDPKHSDYLIGILRVSSRSSNTILGLYVSPSIKEVFPVIQVRRIQRAMRLYLKKKQAERALSLMMCLHPRLGDASALACLPADILRQFCV